MAELKKKGPWDLCWFGQGFQQLQVGYHPSIKETNYTEEYKRLIVFERCISYHIDRIYILQLSDFRIWGGRMEIL